MFTIKKKLLILATVVVLLLAAVLLYTRPLTLAQMYPGVNWDAITQVHIWGEAVTSVGSLYPAPAHADTINYNAQLLPGDPAFDTLVTALREQTFRRSLDDVKHQHQLQPGDIQWQLTLENRGDMLLIYNFYGDLRVSGPGRRSGWTHLSAPDMEGWLAEISDIIRENVAPEAPAP